MFRLLTILMTIWLNDSSPSYNQASGRAPAYLSAADAGRWEKLRQCKLLYTGGHRGYFLDEGRTQFDYADENIGGRVTKRYITYNLLRLVSNTTADLLFGARARIDAPAARQRDAVDNLARRSLLHARLHEAAVQSSWSGGAFLEATVWRGEPYVEAIPCDQIYPLGPLMPDGQYERYARYATAVVEKQTLLLSTTYEPGVIRRRLRTLDDQGAPTGDDLSLDRWPTFAAGAIPEPEERTGIDVNTVTYLANKAGDAVGVSDYDGLVELQDAVNAKFAQVARVLAKHADPKLAVPVTAASEDGTLPASHDVFYFRSKEDIPQYIVWSAELDAALRDREASVLAFCAAAEMSPVLLGIRQGAAPDAARKLRLEATKDLAKAGRKGLIVEPAIARAVEVALRLDQSTPLLRSYPLEPVGVEMRDGLPIDELDQANVIATYRSAGVMSLEDAVEARKEDPDAAAAEVSRLRAEVAAATPNILLGGPATAAADGADLPAAPAVEVPA